MVTRWRRLLIAGLVAVAALLLAILALAVDADAATVALGAAIAAGAVMVIVGLWLEPLRRRQRRAEKAATREARAQGRLTRHAVHAAERRLYTQLESLAWLREALELSSPLPPLRGAAASPDILLELVRTIDRVSPVSVLELGSGASTVVLAARCKAAGAGRVVALEHDAGYAEATRAELRAQGLDDVASVLDAPIVEHIVDGETWPWYTLGPGVPDDVELLLVDGPPAGIGRMARYPALPLLRDRLAPGATIIVDDGDRHDEREMVRRWQAQLDGLEAAHLPHAKGTWRLTVHG